MVFAKAQVKRLRLLCLIAGLLASCDEVSEKRVIPVRIQEGSVKCESSRPENWDKDYAKVKQVNVDGVDCYAVEFNCSVSEGLARGVAYFAAETPERFKRKEHWLTPVGKCLVAFRIKSDIPESESRPIIDKAMSVLLDRARQMEACREQK